MKQFFLAAVYIAALVGVCVVVSAENVWGLDNPLEGKVDTEIFALVLAAMAQTVLVFFVYRQIAEDRQRDKRHRSHQQAAVIADFLAACTSTSTLYTQAAPRAEELIKDPENGEKRRALQEAIDSIESSRQIVHAQKMRVLIFADQATKDRALTLVNQIDRQRGKAVNCLTWADRASSTTQNVRPDPNSIRRFLPEDVVTFLQEKAAADLSG